MAYSNLAGLKALIPEADIIKLTDDEKLKPAAIDPEDADCALIIERIEQAGTSADATIDAYCRGRYTVPLSPVPGKIIQVSDDITAYNLYSRRADLGTMPEIRSERNKEAIRFLEQIAAGKIVLEAAAPAPESAYGGAYVTSRNRVFTRRKMEGF